MNPAGHFLDELQSSVLIGDGAMGTELLARGATVETGIERLNLLAPQLVLQLYRDYVAAGSRVLETNTFAANRPALARRHSEDLLGDILRAGVRLAREAAGTKAYVAGSVGPLPPVEGEPLSLEAQGGLFREQIGILLDAGVDLVLLETFVSTAELCQAVRIARSLSPLPIIAQLAFERDGRTPEGLASAEAFRQCREAGANVIGANCGGGLPAVFAALNKRGPLEGPFSAYINAGYPDQVEGRQVYGATPEYLVQRAVELVELGVRLIGGCCGTGPDFIRRLNARFGAHAKPSPAPAAAAQAAVPAAPPPPPTPLAEEMPDTVVVELDPPKDLQVDPLLRAAAQLKAHGLRTVTLADNPLASVCMDNLTVAGFLIRDQGLQVIPHLTGRDRNRIGLQSFIMGAHALGVRSLLCVTGDPVRMYHETNTSGVFDVTSVGLVRLVSEFNQGLRLQSGARTGFCVGVAVNPNVRTLDGQIRHLGRKIEAGARFALTQPVFDAARFEALCGAMDSAGLKLPIYAGMLPLTSARNADFLHNEVPGIQIPQETRQRLQRYSSVDDQRMAARDLALELMEKLAVLTRRFYLIAPRNRVELVLPLADAARRQP